MAAGAIPTPKSEPTNPPVPTDTPKETPVQNAPEENEEPQGEDEGDADLESARQLQGILKDPERAAAFVKNLAMNYGLIKEETPTKPAEIPTKKSLKAKLAEKFSGMPLFSEELGAVLEEHYEQIRSELREEMQGSTRAIQEAEVDRQVNAYLKTNKISKELENEMEAIGRTMPPGPNVKLEDYLDNLRELGESRLAKKAASKGRVDKINANRSTKPNNIPVAGGDQPAAPKSLSAYDAVKLALEQSQE